MIRARPLAAVISVAVLLTGVAGAPAALAADPVVTPAGFSSDEVSFDGRSLWDEEAGQVVDRLTGTRSAVPACSGDHCSSAGFVRDNPSLVLQFEYGARPIAGEAGDVPWNKSPLTGVYLVNAATGARQRIDTDSSGHPLTASWHNTGSCGNEWCDNFYDFPTVFVSVDSVSRSGQQVAFCANYSQPKVPSLLVKDLGSGRLTSTGLRCPIVHHPEGLYTREPQISADGRVVHVKGDYVDPVEPEYSWDADRLYFMRSGAVRTVRGLGSMTRDGGTIFMRVGVSPVGGARSVTWNQLRHGVYNVRTHEVTRLAGKGALLYGHGDTAFSAFDHASYRGRYVIALGAAAGRAPDRASVVDRRTGTRADITSVLRGAGYDPFVEQWDPLISGDGTAVLAAVSSQGSQQVGSVVITGWQPTARAKVAAAASGSKLRVDVDPNKGSGSWTFRVQAQRADGSWRTLHRTYRTQGAAETRTIDLTAGTYRVTVKAKYGYQGSTSAAVTLAR